jgi:hypothetical protein
VVKQVQRTPRMVRLSYTWRTNPPPGRALQWWLKQLESATTRKALLLRHLHA